MILKTNKVGHGGTCGTSNVPVKNECLCGLTSFGGTNVPVVESKNKKSKNKKIKYFIRQVGHVPVKTALTLINIEKQVGHLVGHLVGHCPSN